MIKDPGECNLTTQKGGNNKTDPQKKGNGRYEPGSKSHLKKELVSTFKTRPLVK